MINEPCIFILTIYFCKISKRTEDCGSKSKEGVLWTFDSIILRTYDFKLQAI